VQPEFCPGTSHLDGGMSHLGLETRDGHPTCPWDAQWDGALGLQAQLTRETLSATSNGLRVPVAENQRRGSGWRHSLHETTAAWTVADFGTVHAP
jgi:hypothetical protein